MVEHKSLSRDDAPAATAKHGNPASESLIDAQGEALARRTVTINRPRQELYSVWRDFARLPEFMDNVVRIDVLDRTRSHWVVRAPGGRTVEWDAIITDDRPGELLAWRSADGADVPNSGTVVFRDAPGGRGTWVTATIAWDPPAGVVGKLVAKLFQREPQAQARHDLRRFKQLMETGEVATSSRTKAQLAQEKE